MGGTKGKVNVKDDAHSMLKSTELQIEDEQLRHFLKVNLMRIIEQFAPRHLIAFGSRVNGASGADSDIDLIIVSEKFNGIPILERSHRFNECIESHVRVDAWCYTVEEFERLRRQVGIVADACRDGVWVIKGQLLSDQEVKVVLSPKEQAREWIAQGESELNKARILYDHREYDGASAYAQQAAEKFLKGLFIARFEATPPRTHDIQMLALALGAPQEIATLGKALTEDYFRARYPNMDGFAPFRVFDGTVAQERISAAEQIRSWVLRQLEQGDER